MWFILAVISAFLQSTGYAIVKRFSQRINPQLLAGGSALVTAIILIIISLFRGVPDIGDGFYVALLVTTLLNTIATLLYFYALKISDFSLSVPLISFTPIFLIATSFFILGELPSIVGSIGILVAIAGSYILNIKNKKEPFLEPIKFVVRDKGCRYMLIVAFIYSITSNYDKIIVLTSDVIFGSAAVFALMGAAILFFFLAKNGDRFRQIKENYGIIAIHGATGAFSAITINIALSMQIVPYVMSLKRTSVIFGVLYGRYLFKEKNMRARLVGAVVMLIGTLMILIFK
ncbi:MAG: EamA family transporter [Candidatus Moraniibacteriota bacterium]